MPVTDSSQDYNVSTVPGVDSAEVDAKEFLSFVCACLLFAVYIALSAIVVYFVGTTLWETLFGPVGTAQSFGMALLQKS